MAQDQFVYQSGPNPEDMAWAGISAAGRALVASNDNGAMRVYLGLAIGADVQAYSATLATWAAKTPPSGVVADKAYADAGDAAVTALIPAVGTIAAQNANNVAITGGSATGLTAVSFKSSGTGTYKLALANTEALGADRTLTVAVGAASRTLTVAADASVAGTNTGDQTLGSLGAAASGANTDITSVYLANTGLKVKDTSGTHGLSIVPGSTLSADRTLTLVTGDTARTVTINADTTLSGTNTGDQVVPTSAAGTDVDTGTDTAKFVTAKAIADAHNVPDIAPGAVGGTLYSDGTDWQRKDGPVDAFVSGSNATNTGQALADIAGLSVACLANSTYEFEAMLLVQSSSTAGAKFGFNYSAAGASGHAHFLGATTSTTFSGQDVAALNTANATAMITTATTYETVFVRGFLVTGANAGNLTVSMLKVTSGTVTCYIGSRLSVRKLA